MKKCYLNKKDEWFNEYSKPRIQLYLRNVENCHQLLVLWYPSKYKKRNPNIVKDYLTTNMSLKEVGDRYGISNNRVRQIVDKSLRILSNPSRRNFIESNHDQ